MRKAVDHDTPIAIAADAAPEPTCRLSARDFILAARTVLARHESYVRERNRVARVRDLLRSAETLRRTLDLYTRHAVVSCCGTRGNGDLEADGQALFRALSNYAGTITNVASDQEGSENDLPATSENHQSRHGSSLRRFG